MGKRLWHLSVLLAALVIAGVVAQQAVAAEGGTTRLMGRLQTLVRQLRELRQDYYKEKVRDEGEIEAARRDGELLRSQLEALREQEALLDAELGDYRSQVRALEAELATKAAVREVVEREVGAFVSAQVRQIEAGIPYRQEQRVARARAALDPNEVGTLSVGGRLGHLWSYAQEELRLAGSSETYTGRAVAEEDVVPYARYFRVGQLLVGYVTEDGRRAAVWVDGPEGGRWQRISDARPLGPLRDAAEILDRRQAPRFVSLPIVLNAAGESEKSP
jgi:hypothetical protein